MKKTKVVLIISLLFLILFLLSLFINLYMISYSKKYIYKSISEIPSKYTIIIPGAKVYSNNISHVARDRIDVVAYEAPELVRYSKELHLARVKSFFLVLFKVKPTYLGEKIPINGNSKDSWDIDK